MGYTHYWYIKEGLKPLSEGCLNDIKSVAQKYGDLIQYESDDPKEPVLSDTLIRFNGRDEDGHETFSFCLEKPEEGAFVQRDEEGFIFDFCKTARKPYDIVVCEMLLILKAELKENMKLNSDGFSNSECSFDGCWNEAIEEVKKMGYNINCTTFSRDEGEIPYYDCEIKEVKKVEVEQDD